MESDRGSDNGLTGGQTGVKQWLTAGQQVRQGQTVVNSGSTGQAGSDSGKQRVRQG